MSLLDAVELVRAALDAGITTFDTAEQYGGGRSETILGKALEGVRGETVLVTKVGYLPGSDGAQDLHLDYEPQDFSPSRIQQACELSLRRLRTTYIDALLLHDPPLQIVRQPEPFEALRRLQQAGKIRWWGVSASAPAAAEAIRLWDAPVVESPFSLADDGVARHVLPNVMSPIMVSATLGIANAIITESALSFLGLGFPPDFPTWGRLLFDGANFISITPARVIWPGLAISLTVLSVNYIGDGLRDALDPRLRGT